MQRSTHSLGLVLLLALGACGGSTEPQVAASRCLQESEFGSSGCAVVAGVVTDPAGRPLAGAYVDARRPADSLRFVTIIGGLTQSDATGRYRVRVIRIGSSQPTDAPDTLSVRVLAAVPPPVSAPPGTRAAVDSSIAVLHWQPVGAMPDTTRVPPIAVPTSG